MPQHSTRSRRVGDQIRRELAMLLAREVADPRLEGLVISDVEVSRDLAYARVFVICPLGSDAKDCLAGLASAGGFMRRHIARAIRLRHVPELRFELDTTLDTAAHMDALIARALPGEAADGAAGTEDTPGRDAPAEDPL